ncbi:Coiled-coil domain-containing protein 12 [Podochytrium sp. JEL0797]|nr:Coiled-coil domain-containing protein 12 [Podochytrium sp. JEL0797]
MADRKARLAELRKLKEGAEEDQSKTINPSEKEEEKKITFRNYDPLTDHVKSLKSNAEPKEGAAPAAQPAKTLETEVKLIEKDAKELLEKQAATSESVEIASLAPRKPGFDLARELERRMEKLEKRTNYAIAENIRKRFKDTHDISEVGDGKNEDSDEDDE